MKYTYLCEIKKNVLKHCENYLSEYPEPSYRHKNQELARQCIDNVVDIELLNPFALALVLAEINEKIVKRRPLISRGLFKFFEGATLKAEPCGLLREGIEDCLYTLLEKGKFQAHVEDLDTKATSMTTVSDVHNYFGHSVELR
jgi:hypothetical protein